MREDLTVVYYTSNREDEIFEKKIQDKLLIMINNLPLVSVSQKPLESFGTNVCVGNVGISEFNLYKQLYIACKASKTKYICTAEADCLYPPKGYFDFMPEDENGFYFNTNIYIMWKGKDYYKKKSLSLFAMFANRELLMERLETCLGRYAENDQWKPDLKKTPIPLFHGRKGMSFFSSELPAISIKTGNGTRWNTKTEGDRLFDLPYWGRAGDLQREVFNEL